MGMTLAQETRITRQKMSLCKLVYRRFHTDRLEGRKAMRHGMVLKSKINLNII
jgi:hypothetical protein